MAKKKATRKKKAAAKKSVETLTHGDASRTNIPTAELEAVVSDEDKSPIRVAYERRNRDLDPQLVWRGKDEQDWSDLVVHAPPLYIQEKVHPKVLVDDLLKQTKQAEEAGKPLRQLDLFADFNGLPEDARSAEFYQHDANWTNRMILGDSLQVMASLAEREGLRGQVQCIYIDPPYGIKFNSDFQWSTTSREVRDGNAAHITREPEQVKAFRDTWRDGIHSYMTYLRDRLTVARDLLSPSGSVFVQIGDENLHRVRGVLEEIFGEDNFCGQIVFATSGGTATEILSNPFDYILWFAKCRPSVKYRQPYNVKDATAQASGPYSKVRTSDYDYRALTKIEKSDAGALPAGSRQYRIDNLVSSGVRDGTTTEFEFRGHSFHPGSARHWKASVPGLGRLTRADRLESTRGLYYRRYIDDFSVSPLSAVWPDTGIAGFASDKIYIVQTNAKVVARCIAMATDPSDLVLDPTCGSGTTAYVAEQWGRRWITIDTSRVALALARARIMGARYPYYLLADSVDGQRKEASLSRSEASSAPAHGNIRHGFVYDRVPHITLRSIANNAEIDVLWERFQETLKPLREQLNAAMGRVEGADGNEPWQEWEIPREAGEIWGATAVAAHGQVMKLRDEFKLKMDFLVSLDMESQEDRIYEQLKRQIEQPLTAINELTGNAFDLETLPNEPRDPWPEEAKKLHAEWWKQRIARQKEIDASIAAKADFEFLYDKPYQDSSKVRVAGPFTFETVSPHRVLAVDADDELIDPQGSVKGEEGSVKEGDGDFVTMILENLKTAGVQQAHKEDRITFTSVAPWPGHFVCAEGRYTEGDADTGTEKRAGILVGPEFGTVSRADLAAAAREASEAGFDVLVSCAFNYEAHASEFTKLGRLPILKARMNADLHMGEDLKQTNTANLFVVFGEPDIDILPVPPSPSGRGAGGEGEQLQVKINGVDVFHPNTGEVRSDGADGIACWFIDTDYNEESFFVRHAYFLGANDPYKALKTTLKAEINEEAWASLHSDTSRPFDKPKNGRIAVKVINHLGDEVMKVFRV